MSRVIGISGGSASGKTSFCNKLQKKLKDKTIYIIHMDSFFKNKNERPYLPSHISGKFYTDDNSPDTVDWEAFHSDFDKAFSDDKIEVVIVEGLLVLWDSYIQSRIDIKIFVDCRSDERIVRRIFRNMQWGQTLEEITDVYLDMVRFRHDQYVEPQKWTADFIVNGSGNTDLICDMLCDKIFK